MFSGSLYPMLYKTGGGSLSMGSFTWDQMFAESIVTPASDAEGIDDSDSVAECQKLTNLQHGTRCYRLIVPSFTI